MPTSHHQACQGLCESDTVRAHLSCEAHRSVQEDIHLEDRIWVEAILNHKIKPIWVEHGYKVADGYFEFDKTENIDIQTQLDMDIKLNAIVPIDPDYFASKYNVPLAKVKPQEQTSLSSGEGKSGAKSKPKESLKKSTLSRGTHAQPKEEYPFW